MRIDTKVGVVEYINLVEDIAAGFIAEDGSYIPHAGRLHAMQIFYENFYAKDDEPKPAGDNPSAFDTVFSDEDFIYAYRDALDDGDLPCLNFSNAYSDAMQIVSDRRSSLIRGVNMVSKFIEQYFTPDNMAKIFGESNRFNEIVGADGDKVISFVEQALKKE